MRIMGLDVGSKTVGVAISDPLGFTAQGLEIIQIDEEQGQFGFERLGALVSEYKVDKFVIGLPKNMNNTIGPQGEKVLAFVDELKNFLKENKAIETSLGKRILRAETAAIVVCGIIANFYI